MEDTRIEETSWEAVVVGAGAAGLSAALVLGRARRRVLVVDAGLPRNRFATHVHGVLGHDGTPPPELAARGRAEAAGYGVRFHPGAVARVDDADADAEDALRVTLADATTLRADAVVLATGSTDVLPDVPGLAQRWGTGVLHCPYCHGWEVRDGRLGVLLTSPAGLHQAQLVRQWSDRVTVLAAPGLLDDAALRRLRARGVAAVTERVVEVLGDGPRVTGVRTADGTQVALDALFTAPTPRPQDDAVAALRLDRVDGPAGPVGPDGGLLAVDATGRTSHPRVWAAGNVVAPMANVAMAAGAGSLVGAAVNGALVASEFDAAEREVARG